MIGLHRYANANFTGFSPQVLDLVSSGVVPLHTVRDIPGTLYGLYTWLCHTLCHDLTLYRDVTRRVLNVVLAAREPLTRSVVWESVRTRDDTIQVTLC